MTLDTRIHDVPTELEKFMKGVFGMSIQNFTILENQNMHTKEKESLKSLCTRKLHAQSKHGLRPVARLKERKVCKQKSFFFQTCDVWAYTQSANIFATCKSHTQYVADR